MLARSPHAAVGLPRVIVADCDVAVIGAGPAGSMAARLLAGRGADVALIDRAAFPRFKVCGCCLNADALQTLERGGMGAAIAALGGRPLTRMVAAAGGRQATVDLPEGLALSRESLDEALVAGATARGARLFERTTAYGLEATAAGHRLWLRDRVREMQRSLSARLVLVADGLGGSFLRAAPGFAVRTEPNARMGLGTVLSAADADYPAGTIHMACGRWGYCGVVRLEQDRLAVAAAVERAFLRACGGPGAAAARLLAEADLPALGGLEAAAWQGTPGLTREGAPRAQPGVFLLGDAAGYVEPFTGEGMAWALASGEAAASMAAPALESGRAPAARDWSRVHRRLCGQRHRRCQRVARALRHPVLVQGAIRALAQAPALGAALARRFGDARGGVGRGSDALH